MNTTFRIYEVRDPESVAVTYRGLAGCCITGAMQDAIRHRHQPGSCLVITDNDMVILAVWHHGRWHTLKD